tara:strand:- start:1584 stop:2318 length:735 start_codon:yes stop_codon:yes gene_type:complete
MTSLLNPGNIKSLYNLLVGSKKREKLDYILEPLQAMIQICFLNFCPIGSKLTINDNILQIQLPGVSQGMIRFFNDDTKEDLYFLFNVFRRFIHYYKHFQNEQKFNHLYELILRLAKGGIDKLITTYRNSEKISVLHTLQMYKVMLDKPEFFNPNFQSSELDGLPDLDKVNILKNNNIDNIFDKIVNIYSYEEYKIIYNTLLILTKKSKKDNYEETTGKIMNGLNTILYPTFTQIKEWIHKNVAL